jgi:transcriptional regulator with XRE-family HTH domain
MPRRRGSALPVSPLRVQRLRKGWTQQQVADKLYDLCVACGADAAGITTDMVSRWELGVRSPSMFYRRLLGELFGCSLDALGLVPSATSALVPVGLSRSVENGPSFSFEEISGYSFREWGPSCLMGVGGGQ